MLRAEIWARCCWIKILLLCCWLCGVAQITPPLWAPVFMPMRWKKILTLWGCQSNSARRDPRPPELPGSDPGSHGSAWPLAPQLLLIFWVQLNCHLSEKPRWSPVESPMPIPPISNYLLSLLLVSFLPSLWHSLWFSCLLVVLFCLFCVLTAGCLWPQEWGHQRQRSDPYCLGTWSTLISAWLTYSRWLENLKEDPYHQGKLLSPVSPWLFRILIPGAILKSCGMVKRGPGWVSLSTGSKWHEVGICSVRQACGMAYGVLSAPQIANNFILFFYALLSTEFLFLAYRYKPHRMQSLGGKKDVTLKNEKKKTRSFMISIYKTDDLIYNICGSGQWVNSHINPQTYQKSLSR